MTEIVKPTEIRNLWPEAVDSFNLEVFREKILSTSSFEGQIEIFDKYFNLFIKHDLSVITQSYKILFSIYCACNSCKEKGERYSIEKEQIIKRYRARKFVNLQKELDAIPNIIERVYYSFKYFGENYAPGIHSPYEDAPEEFVISLLPKSEMEKSEWNLHVIDEINEAYFYNENDSNSEKSFEYLMYKINRQLRFAVYPKEELDQEIERVKEKYGKPNSDVTKFHVHNRKGIEEFRYLVSGKPFDIFNGFSARTFVIVRLEQYHAVQYLKYLEDVKKHLSDTGTLPISIASNPLPPSYDLIITRIIRTLAKRYTSKSDYNLIDDQIKNLSQEQAYAFLSQINEGLQYILIEHSKICQHPASSCTRQQSIEQAHNSITTRMLKFLPVEPQTKPTETNGMLSGLNNSQTVLLIYYVLKIFGLEPRKGMDVSQAAKIAHLLTGKEFTTINNSDLYQKFKQVPNFKQDKGLIDDLEIIKLRFIKAQLNEAVKMIDNEIEMAKREKANK